MRAAMFYGPGELLLDDVASAVPTSRDPSSSSAGPPREASSAARSGRSGSAGSMRSGGAGSVGCWAAISAVRSSSRAR